MLISAISSSCIVPYESLLLIRTPVLLDEVATCMTSFNLNYFFKDTIFKYSHIGVMASTYDFFFRGVTIQSPVVILLFPFYRKENFIDVNLPGSPSLVMMKCNPPLCDLDCIFLTTL